jgi:hypothetical protein
MYPRKVSSQEHIMTKKRKKLHGTVKKVIKPAHPTQAEKAQIDITEADDLYREIRVDNVLTDDEGKKERLEPGDEVDVTIEKDSGQKKKSA